MASWYVSSVGWTAVTAWAALTSYSVGDLRRQLAAPAVGSERVFRCTTAGISGAAEPTWTITQGGTTNDATAVWTEVTGQATYGWTAPQARIANAIAWGAAGDTYYIGSNHAETQSTALTITFKGTTSAPDTALSVNVAGSVPPVAADLLAGASITTTGTSAIIVRGYVYGYGVTFNCGTGASTANLSLSDNNTYEQTWEACAFNILNSSAGSKIPIGCSATVAPSKVSLKNCRCSFSATTHSIQPFGLVNISNQAGATFVSGATIPTSLFNGGYGTVIISGVDLSASGSGKNIFSATVSAATPSSIVNCKLNASVTPSLTPNTGPYAGLDVIGSNSTTTVERNERYRYQGTLTTETTIIRTSPAGATDGTTAYSWKIVTTANSKLTFPFQCFEGAIWNTSTSSQTLTIGTLTNNVTLTDADIWVEVEYLGSASTPVASLITDRCATILTTPANQTTNSDTWASAPGTPVTQQCNVTFTCGMAGLIRWRIMVAKASTTVYIDPKPVIT